jgi:pimeloyl-ACP methyl ester carboxylesterase
VRTLCIFFLALFLAFALSAQKRETVSFPTDDGGLIFADLYGHGDRAVVLAHGGQFSKESWEKQADTLAKAGFRVLALDFRGFGPSRGPGQTDPLSAPLYFDELSRRHEDFLGA